MKKLIFGVICCGMLFLSGCGQSPEENFNEAKSLYEAQNYDKAFKLYQKAAEQGHVKAIDNLAWCYNDGKGVKEDKAEAVKWWRKAAEQGYANSQCSLGYSYNYGRGIEKDYKEAVKWYQKAAEQGDGMAQNNLGTMYEFGQGVFQDKKEALRWYLSAVENGEKEYSIYNIGRFLETKKKKNEAYAFYALACKNGKDTSDSMHYLKNSVSEGSAVELSKKLEDEFFNKECKGDAKTQFIIAEIYKDAENYKGAMQWYKKSAEKGYAGSQMAIGEFYDSGKGVDIDKKEALKWYRKAADKGDSYGQKKVGDFYYSGIVVKASYKEALKWYIKAEEHSYQVRRRNILVRMGECEFYMKNYKNAIECFHAAVKQQNALSKDCEDRLLLTLPSPHFYIGVCYLKGYGVVTNKYEALAWFKEAEKAGDFLIALHLKGMKIDIDKEFDNL